jgi:hypothetical protein
LVVAHAVPAAQHGMLAQPFSCEAPVVEKQGACAARNSNVMRQAVRERMTIQSNTLPCLRIRLAGRVLKAT